MEGGMEREHVARGHRDTIRKRHPQIPPFPSCNTEAHPKTHTPAFRPMRSRMGATFPSPSRPSSLAAASNAAVK